MSSRQKTGKKRTFFDYTLVFIIVCLIVYGLLMIYSASSYSAQIKFQDPAYFLKKQGLIAAAGFVVMLIVSKFDYHFIMKFVIPIYIVSLILMALVPFLGTEINGQKRWLRLGPVSLQPTEVAKIAVILILAVYISNMGDEINTWKGVLKVVLIDAPLAGLVGMNNLSSGIIVLMIAVVMSFVASKNKAIYLLGLVAIILLFVFVEPISDFLADVGLLKPYQLTRIKVWLDPEAYPQKGGYQVLQGLYAIGSGGLRGKGLGESIQKLGFVPEAENDMIFSIICEEMGFFGALSLIILYLFLIYRFLMIANSAPDKYGCLIVTGVMAHIAIQVILNIAVVSNVIPNTGITLPFISYGGTSILLLMAEMGLVLSVARQIKLDY